MGSLITELRRRNVDRAAVFYAGASWLIVQVATQVFPFFHVDDSVVRGIVIAAVIGFPFAMLFSWLYEWTPQGIKRESEIDRSQSVTTQTGKTLDRAIIAVLSVTVVLLLADHFRAQHTEAPATPVAAGIPDIDKDPSIAVLPFTDLSQARDQGYFSDGISEELLNLLAKVPKLRVIARTSSFSFRGKEAAVPEIARALGVAAILEGSVRKSGNTLRISVQLVRAVDSTELWADTYDRAIDDIFKVQDDIAAAVVKKLKVSLLGSAPTVIPVDPRAYPLILQAKALGDHASADGHTQAIALYRQALAISPNEPRAWSGLGRIYLAQALYSEIPAAEGNRLAKEALNKAIALAPDDALSYSRLAGVYSQLDNDPVSAAALHQKALALDPGNLSVIGSAAIFLQLAGRLNEAIALDEYRAAHDPANPTAYGNLGNEYYFSGRWTQAISAYRTVLSLSPGYAQAHFGIGCSLLQNKGDAAQALKEMQAEPDEVAKMTGMPLALRALGRKADSDTAMTALIAQHEKDGPFNIAAAYSFLGDTDRAFEWLDKAIDLHDSGLSYIHLEPLFRPLYKDPRWLPLLRRLGQAPEQLAKIDFKVTLPDAAAAATMTP